MNRRRATEWTGSHDAVTEYRFGDPHFRKLEPAPPVAAEGRGAAIGGVKLAGQVGRAIAAGG
jgi:hypothetical protein